MASSEGNDRERTPRRPKQVHWIWTDRLGHRFDVAHVVLGGEITPVAVRQSAAVAIVQDDRAVFGDGAQTRRHAWR